jgi:hypothetical protein
MKLQDIQSALLKDKETLFSVKGERNSKRFVIESIETKEETYGTYSWNVKTRTVNYAVGTWYYFVASEAGRTSYDGSWIEPKPARFIDGKFRSRISQLKHSAGTTHSASGKNATSLVTLCVSPTRPSVTTQTSISQKC